ncbi:RNA polymerase sigma factor [Pseudoxanthomonas dokdonensis]|uniref:RNA polymerase sigma factor n=1 Tax=Pseudoxanthomonas dokdonensis TaxID=344882 RepID=A0A0R0CVU6_9GAMM|nr:sigma-70 family RNA polymerase sigma factor [Pseudoxanthomonas dokdonensis]KRG69812.1 hypothetical protein ABB29_08430 [Pseudoxanthomonas dokdonensis]
MIATQLEPMLHETLPAARAGDEDAYGRIVAACQNTVTAIALAITRDVASSEDIAQEAFLKAWQQLDKLHHNSSFLPWLRQITRNLARDWLRANRRRPLIGEAAELAIRLSADPSPSPAESMARTEQEQVANELISALPAESRETLLLYYREDQSSKQVAELLGLSDAAVRKRLSRARALVRSEMLSRFGEFACSSAPGSAFTLTVVGALVMATPATSAAAVIGSGLLGGGVGKLGSGSLLGGAISSSATGGSAGVLLAGLIEQMPLWQSIGLGIGAGLLSYLLSWWYLSSFCETADEYAQIRRFLWRNSVTGMLWLLTLLLVISVSVRWWPIVLVFAAGLTVVNYQYVVILPRIMRPLLAKPGNARRRRSYSYLAGPTSIVLSSVLAVTALISVLWNKGLL